MSRLQGSGVSDEPGPRWTVIAMTAPTEPVQPDADVVRDGSVECVGGILLSLTAAGESTLVLADSPDGPIGVWVCDGVVAEVGVPPRLVGLPDSPAFGAVINRLRILGTQPDH